MPNTGWDKGVGADTSDERQAGVREITYVAFCDILGFSGGWRIESKRSPVTTHRIIAKPRSMSAGAVSLCGVGKGYGIRF